jgi:hypothetical protein
MFEGWGKVWGMRHEEEVRVADKRDQFEAISLNDLDFMKIL